MKIKIKQTANNKYKDDCGHTFESMNAMLEYHGLIFAQSTTAAQKPPQYIFVDEHGHEISLS